MNDFDPGFTEIRDLDTQATLRVSLFGVGPAPTALLFATYRQVDPLIITLEVRTPEEVTVFRRLLLRADFAVGLTGPTAHAGTRMLPVEGRMIEISFTEDGASVAVRIPEAAARRFLGLSYRIVPIDDEGAVLGDLAAELALDRG
ncbi:MAG TPA: SsgA family sporulation/cell division regulator [Actinomycetota bacterium]|nr:SsgA family sporulation/cell division regulator [Actinomycetota bacterium]